MFDCKMLCANILICCECVWMPTKGLFRSWANNDSTIYRTYIYICYLYVVFIIPGTSLIACYGVVPLVSIAATIVAVVVACSWFYFDFRKQPISHIRQRATHVCLPSICRGEWALLTFYDIDRICSIDLHNIVCLNKIKCICFNWYCGYVQAH